MSVQRDQGIVTDLLRGQVAVVARHKGVDRDRVVVRCASGMEVHDCIISGIHVEDELSPPKLELVNVSDTPVVEVRETPERDAVWVCDPFALA